MHVFHSISTAAGQILQRVPKKVRWAGLATLVVAIILGLGLGLGNRNTGETTNTASVASNHGNIVVNEIRENMALKDGQPVAGTFTPRDNATLYYIVRSDSKKALGFGNIAVDKNSGKFSRNLTFDGSKTKGKTGQLYIYMQDDRGKKLDEATVSVRFE